MAHKAHRKFVRSVRSKFPKYFRGTSVADVGSLDINGSNRRFFRWPARYVGIDIVKGKNVDIVGFGHEVLPRLVVRFDTIISTNSAEHDKHWEKTFAAMYEQLLPGGLLLINAAGDGFEEHGTYDFHSWASPGTNDYYKNISNEMLSSVLKPDMFSIYYLGQNTPSHDCQFYGIKKQ
jgi:SAM-dependent methyltransferase